MRNIPWEAWAGIIILIVAALIPIIVGKLIVKLFRHFRPIEQQERTGLSALGTEEEDGFFKTTFIGWAVCIPAYWVLYRIFSYE